MEYLSRISTRGQMVIPSDLRKELGLSAGTSVTVRRRGNELVISPANWDAVFALCGKYAGMGLEQLLIEEKRKERELEDRRANES